MIVAGDKDIENGVVSVRSRKDGDIGQMKLEELIAKLTEEIEKKIIQ